MEHHLLPNNARPTQPSEVQVLCRCDPPFYHGKQGDFLKYPNIRDRPWLAFTDHKRYRYQVWNYVFQHPQPTHELEAFFQEWLFFGFLTEALGENFNPVSFTRMESGLRVIDTSNLPSVLDEAFHQRVQSPEDFEIFHSHISNCLMVLVCLVGLARKSSYVNPAFDKNILFSITSSAHRVVSSISHGFACRHGFSEKFAALIPVETLEYPNDDVKQHMIQAGWCPSELHILNRKFRSLQTLFALSRMNRKFFQQDHTRCTIDLCKRYRNSMDAFLPEHTSSSCSCAQYDDQKLKADVSAILLKDRGTIPVLDIHGDKDNLRINVIEATPDVPYVAYSHVWADGLGNSKANSLPRCQLHRLQTLAQLLETQEKPSTGDSQCYVWVDTICCPCVSTDRPESSKAKRIAINHMRQTYTRATCVLVLDAALQQQNFNELPAWEALLRIFTSGWSSRLWCLQEGVLPAKLYFQFQDQSVSSHALRLSLLKEMAQDSRVGDIGLDLADEYHWLDQKRSPSQQYTNYGTAAKDFIALIGGLQGRAVSVASDEALCITTMLDVSIEQVQNEPEHAEDRMCKLWELVDEKYQGIPIGILACEYPRLQKAGYRWAPCSLLKSLQTNWLGNFGHYKEGRLVKNLGFSFRTSGFVVRRRQWSDGLHHNNPWHQLGCRMKSFGCSTFQETSTAQFYWFNSSFEVQQQMAGKHKAGSGYNYLDEGPSAILQMTELSPERNCTALIGKLKQLPDGRHLITDTLLVTHGERSSTDNLILSAAQAIARNARRIPCVALLDKFQAEGDHSMEQPAVQEARQSLFDFLLSEANTSLEDSALMQAVTEKLYANNNGPAMYLGVIARDWFFNDYEGTYYEPDTEWIVD